MLQYGMARATRTLNPLHFEDLEPHRFEDLVRQLAYDYRPWASIEATGRGGADDGIDIRAFEPSSVPFPEEADEEDLPPLVDSGRLWIIQCKREKRIGPAQVRRYVQESVTGPEVPYGFILAAACDFSKKAYDAFRAALVGTGVQEFHLWGKAELEDMLFQPKNDHLLFAYFGISLQTRKRSKQTELRARLALRKRMGRVLGSLTNEANKDILFRDAHDETYPVIDECPDFMTRPRWGIYKVIFLNTRNALILELRRHLGYMNSSTGEWDALPESIPPVRDHTLYGLDEEQDALAWQRRVAWRSFVPAEHQAELVVVTRVALDRVLGIDEEGDLFHPLPTLYVEPLPSGQLLDAEDQSEFLVTHEGTDRHKEYEALPAKRISFFKDFTLENKNAPGS